MLINQVVQAIPRISIVLRTLITACNQCTFREITFIHVFLILVLSVQHPQHETIHTWIHFLIGSASSLLVLNLLILLFAHVTSQHD